MGRLTLLLVAAAVLGGSLLTFSSRRVASSSQAGQRGAQADLLSRQITESGHAIVLASIVGETGFTPPAATTRSYDGGSYRVVYNSATPTRVTYTVTGDFQGATHAIKSTYEWDPMSYPSPIWLDVPYATSTAEAGSSVSGKRVIFDRRKHDALGLESLAGLAPMTSALNGVAGVAGNSLYTPDGNDWNWLVEDLNVRDGEGLYQTALAQTPELTLPGPHTVTSNQLGLGAPDEVVHVTGDLTVEKRMEGKGVLVVDGALEVTSTGRLGWRGIVIVRDERQYLPVMLNGSVDITGSLVIVQHAYPPGGHMDVTTWRDLGSGLSPSNVRGEGAVTPWGAGFPWHQHKHRFDEDLGTREVRYLRNGGAVAAQEAWTQFEDTIDRLGSDDVYLEFENESNHGYGVYTLDVDGMAQPMQRMVRDGFGSFARGGNVHQSQSFKADDLEDFSIDVRTLRTLQARYDGQGCDSWPFCIGENWDRGGALRVRLRNDSDDKILYESVLYWHMQTDEWAIYQGQEAAWRTQIESGALFGTRLEVGQNVNVAYDVRPILALVDRMGFDGNEVIHLGTETEHGTADQNLARATAADGRVRICHDPGNGGSTQNVARDAVQVHLGHGDRLFGCDGSAPAATSAPAVPSHDSANAVPPGPTVVCHQPGSPAEATRVYSGTALQNHLGHGDSLGACVSS